MFKVDRFNELTRLCGNRLMNYFRRRVIFLRVSGRIIWTAGTTVMADLVFQRDPHLGLIGYRVHLQLVLGGVVRRVSRVEQMARLYRGGTLFNSWNWERLRIGSAFVPPLRVGYKALRIVWDNCFECDFHTKNLGIIHLYIGKFNRLSNDLDRRNWKFDLATTTHPSRTRVSPPLTLVSVLPANWNLL